MQKHLTFSSKAFNIFNYVFLGVVAFMCLLPLLNVLAVSFSSKSAAAAGYVKLWPVGLTLDSYMYALKKHEFITAFLVSIKRVGLGYLVNMVLTVLIAYPLSKEKTEFSARNIYAWFFIVTMLFGGGLIPTYMVIRYTGLIDSIWALIIPNAVPVFNVIILMNFFRGVPKEIEEAAFIDGASYWKTLYRIYLPLSLPSIATLSLFVLVGHWNGWFDGLIYMNSSSKWPLQSYLRSIIINSETMMSASDELATMGNISNRTFNSAQVILAALPVLIVYPFLQKYFMKGLTMGSVKG